MARQFDFEEKVSGEHPDDLHDLARAAKAAGEAMAELDEIVNRKMGGSLTFIEYTALSKQNGDLMALSLDAWRLRNAIRAEGERRLAEWEESVRGNEGE